MQTIIEQSSSSKEEQIVEGPKFRDKLSNFKTYPKSSLLILSDFDHTLTKRYYDGHSVFNSFQYLEESKRVSKDILARAKFLYQEYGVYERDTSVPFEMRLQKMEQWYDLILKAIVDEKINKKDFDLMIDDIIELKRLMFRYGISKFFEIIKKERIPLILVSAGIYEGIKSSLIKLIGRDNYDYLVNENLLKILANQFQYDEQQNVIGVADPIIHTFNKNEHTKSLIEQIGKQGGNFIVIGDHYNDIDMVNKSKYNDVIGVGFENTDSNENMLNKYDICIKGDGDFKYINELIENLYTNK